MKRVLLSLFSILMLALTSCVSTDVYLSPLTMDDSLSVEEKFEALGKERILVDEPDVFFSGQQWLDKLMELTEESEDYILISTFLGSSSELLEPFYELLCQKAESGVDVYLIMDGSSSYDMTESKEYLTPLYFLRDRGVHLLEYSPYTVTHLISPATLMIREHRKLFVFDGKCCAIGGMNLNYISLGAGDMDQRDSMYLFRSGSLCSSFIDEFVSIWNGVSVEKIDRDDFVTSDGGDEAMLPAYLFNQGPGGDDSMAELYSVLINSAKEEILFLPYLPALDENMMASLVRAKERGVKITMLIPIELFRYSGEGIAYILPDIVPLCHEFYLCYIDKGVKPTNLHEKLMVVDGRYSVIGSTNFNYRSMGLSNEIAMVIDSPAFAAMERSHFYDRISEGSILIDEKMAEEMKDDMGSFFIYLFMYYGG